MEQPKLNLKKVRDFGEVINDTFIFLKQNFKPLFKILIPISILFVVANIVLSTFQIISLQDLVKENGGNNVSGLINKTLVTSFITGLFGSMVYFIVALTTYCYVAVYIENKSETPEMAQVWGFFKYYFFRYIGIRLLTAIGLVLGFMLCLLPGIYLMPIVSLTVAAVVLENRGAFNAIGRAFTLIKQDWWMSFGTLMILIMILYAFVITLALPSMILGGSASLFTPNLTRPVYAIIIQSIISSISVYSYVIVIIGNCILFYSLVEKKESEGLLDRINDLNHNQSNSQEPTEEF
jgi:hypothetical protein